MYRRAGVLTAAAWTPLYAHQSETDIAGFDWSWDPLVIVCLTGGAWLYRSARPGWGLRPWERASYWTGWLILAVALVSPLHAAGEALFSAHMIQHEVLMAAAAPLIVLGRPAVALVWQLPARTRPRTRAVFRFLQQPWVAWAVHFAALWLWHIPRLFQATLSSGLAHSLQHTCFLASALWFWWAVLGAGSRCRHGAGILLLFTTAIHTSILGALLTFSNTLWYPAYANTVAWGLTPIEDQQLGGLIMWVPAGFVYVIAGLALGAQWLNQSERRNTETTIHAAIV
ncbi:MAG: cytochrome c oxidase assembly protein [Bryobacterales bacterium]|nr:cytochrome c oxidase assembly protein [Bryobacterales bacterium]